jgi:hypothetical protein
MAELEPYSCGSGERDGFPLTWKDLNGKLPEKCGGPSLQEDPKQAVFSGYQPGVAVINTLE